MNMSIDGQMLVVSHTDRGDVIRIISAREASRRERKDYEDGNFPQRGLGPQPKNRRIENWK